jgi:hypothetical protein
MINVVIRKQTYIVKKLGYIKKKSVIQINFQVKNMNSIYYIIVT